MKTALSRGIYHSNELRSLLLKNQALSGGAGASSGGVECEKKAKVVGWRKRYVLRGRSHDAAIFAAIVIVFQILFFRFCGNEHEVPLPSVAPQTFYSILCALLRSIRPSLCCSYSESSASLQAGTVKVVLFSCHYHFLTFHSRPFSAFSRAGPNYLLAVHFLSDCGAMHIAATGGCHVRVFVEPT
jgi:hypothetical protein